MEWCRLKLEMAAGSYYTGRLPVQIPADGTADFLSVDRATENSRITTGNELTVLFESENKTGYINGFTENYVKVKTPWNPELVNTLHKVKLTEIDKDGLVRFNFSKETIEV